MGIFIKNRKLRSGSTSVVLPAGTSAQRPTNPIFGQIRFNIDNGIIEYFDGTVFQDIAYGLVDFTVDSFVGDGSTSVYQMTFEIANPETITVFIGSIYQPPNTYSVNGSFDITFAAPIPSGETINIIHAR